MNSLNFHSKNNRFIFALLQNLTYGVLVFDRRVRIVAANRAIEHVFGSLIRIQGHRVGSVFGCMQAVSSSGGCGSDAPCRKCKLRLLVLKAFDTDQVISENVTMEMLVDSFFTNITIGMNLIPFRFEDKRYVIMEIPDSTSLKSQPYPLATDSFHGIIGHDPAMQKLFSDILKIAATDASVLIQGESGTGKELVARSIHKESRRYGASFVPLNCGALPEGIVSSELFGHEKGAFTGALREKKGRFELARGGTLFLDEVGELPMPVQIKLLRVLQEGTYERVGGEMPLTSDLRIISATNKNLENEVAAGRFRRDLYYRLCVMPLSIPPLRMRKSDIPLLADFFLTEYAKKMAGTCTFYSDRALKAMTSYTWPGNVRELQNVIQYALIHCSGHSIEPSHLPVPLRHTALPVHVVRKRRRLEPSEVAHALARTGGNKQHAARLLGISRSSLYRFFQRHESGTSTDKK